MPPGARKTAGNAGALAPKQAQPQATASDSNAVNGSLAQKLRDDASKKDGTPALNVTEVGHCIIILSITADAQSAGCITAGELKACRSRCICDSSAAAATA